MNSKRNLKSVSSLLLIGVCLILIGYLIYFSNKTSVVKINSLVISTATPSQLVTFTKVIRVVDGDTIEVEDGQKVRYIGVNTPELQTSECFATQAAEINKNLVLGKVVKLKKDVSDTDKYSRLLRYVYINDMLVNNELLKNGAAKIETIPPDTKYKNEFTESEKYAKDNNLGLWSNCF